MTIGSDAQPCNDPSVETVEPSLLVSNSSDQSFHLPKWVKEQRGSWGERLFVSEWEDEKGYRVDHGWKVRTVQEVCLFLGNRFRNVHRKNCSSFY